MKKDNNKATKEFGSNFLLNAAKKHLTNKNNKAPAAKFIQRQNKLKNMLDQM